MEKVSSENKEGERERETEHYIDNENSNNGEKLCSVWEEKEFPFRGDGGGRGGGVIHHSWKVSEVSTFIRKLDDAYIITL